MSADAEAQLASQLGEPGDEFEGKAAESLKNKSLPAPGSPLPGI